MRRGWWLTQIKLAAVTLVMATSSPARAQDNSAGGTISGSIDGGTESVQPQSGVQPESFSYPVGLNPSGDNFLALRSLPSAVAGLRLARLGPDALFKVVERAGDWMRVRLRTGETGWVSTRYVGCCRTAVAAAPEPVGDSGSCDDLWYRRNAIYKAAGYCFRTDRAIGTFGNAGCRYDNETNVPLSARQRGELVELRHEEESQGCGQ